MTYILVDTANTFFRARHAVRGDTEIKIGMALHVTFNSIKKAWGDFDGKHVVFCLEGRSWRKDVYAPYKANRAVAKAAMTQREVEEDELFYEVFNEFIEFVKTKTNCTVLQHPRLEADDLIAGFIQAHPHADHVIISSDTDFHQLIAPNVRQYNGIAETTTTHEGVFDAKGRPVIDKKTKEAIPAPNPQWILFEKCIRGDTSDNIFSAYPGVRVKGTKNKVGLLEAFGDRNSKGWAWNNLMLQRWVDHNKVEHRVKDDYERNKLLIDLTAQPEEIRALINETIAAQLTEPKDIGAVGIRMMKFCQQHELKRIIDSIQSYAVPFQAKYTDEYQSEAHS